MKKEYTIAGISVAVAITIAILFFPSSITEKTKIEYPGIRIYEAVNTIERLLYKGFDFEVEVEGKDYLNREVKLEGYVINTGNGYFILATEGNKSNNFRIVEGPLGSKDIRADKIRIIAKSPFVIEAIFPPQSGEKLLLKQFEKYKSSIVFKNANISLIEIQKLKNIFPNFYSVDEKIKTKIFGNEILMVINYPVSTNSIAEFLKKINYTEFITGYNYYYTYANSEEEVKDKIEKLRKKGAVLVNFYAFWD